MTHSYWHATAPHVEPAADLPRTAEVVVIGGGIVGVSAVYWLARHGVPCVLLERTALVAGATGRNGGFVTAGAAMSYIQAIEKLGHQTARAIWQLTEDNRALLRQVLAEEQIACDYRETGTLHLILGEDDIPPAQREVARLVADGFRYEWLDRSALQRSIRTPLGDEIVGATLLVEGGLLQPARLVQGIARAAQRYGAVLCRADATAVKAHGERIRVETASGRIDCGGLIVAVNAWTHPLVPSMQRLIVPVRGQVVSFAPIERVFTHGMGAAVTKTEEYWQQTSDGTIVLGGCRAIHPTREEGILDDALADDVQAALEAVLPRLFPELKGRLCVERRWSGPMAFTPDRLPIATRVPHVPNAWFAGGFCGHGMPFGLIFGRLLAEAAMNDRVPRPLEPFGMEGRWLGQEASLRSRC